MSGKLLTCQFEVIHAEEQVSKKQVPMLRLTLKIESDEKNYWITDYISEHSPSPR